MWSSISDASSCSNIWSICKRISARFLKSIFHKFCYLCWLLFVQSIDFDFTIYFWHLWVKNIASQGWTFFFKSAIFLSKKNIALSPYRHVKIAYVWIRPYLCLSILFHYYEKESNLASQHCDYHHSTLYH